MTKDEIRATLAHLERLAIEGLLPSEVYESHKQSLSGWLLTQEATSDTTALPSFARLGSTSPWLMRGESTQPIVNAPPSFDGPLEQRTLDTFSPFSPLPSFDGDHSQQLAIGTLLRKRYCLVEWLGEGSTGTVFRAKDVRFGGEYAIKVLHPSVAKSADGVRFVVQAFRRMAALCHPHFVRVFHMDEDPHEDLLFCVMEWVPGRTLAQTLNRAMNAQQQPPFSVQQVLSFLQKLSQPLGWLHEQGTVHRALKPTNIILTGEENKLELKLLDIGISRRLRSRGSQPGLHTGEVNTLFYIAPEQLAGGDVTPAADIFSVGVTLYTMLTGTLPSMMAPGPSYLYPHYPEAIDKVLQRTMHVEHTQRYQTIHELLTDFARAFSMSLEGLTDEGFFYLPDWLMQPTTPAAKRPPKEALEESKESLTQSDDWGESVLLLPLIEAPKEPKATDHPKQAEPPKEAKTQQEALTPAKGVPPFTPFMAEHATTSFSASHAFPQHRHPLEETIDVAFTMPKEEREPLTLASHQLLTLPLGSGNPPQLCVSKDGRFLASVSGDSPLQLWETQSWRPLHKINPFRSQAPLTALIWSPDDDLLVVGTSEGNVCIWDHLHDSCLAYLTHPSAVCSIEWGNSLDPLCVGCEDGDIHMWSPLLGQHIASIHSHHTAIVAMASQTHNSQGLIASTDTQGHTHLLHTHSRTVFGALPYHPTFCMPAFSPTRDELIIGETDGSISLWNHHEKTCTDLLDRRHHQPITTLATCLHQPWLASGSLDSELYLWSLDDQSCIAHFPGHTQPIASIAIDPQGRWLASVCEGGELRIWNTRQLTESARQK